MENTIKKSEEKTFIVNEVGSILERLDESVKVLAESMGIKFENVNGRFDKVETKIDRLQDDMVEVKFELKRKVDVDQLEKLEKRVVKLEKVAFSH